MTTKETTTARCAVLVGPYTSGKTTLMEALLFAAEAIHRKGFSFIEVIVPCFTQYGRRNRKEGTIEMMEWLREIVDLRVGCPPHEAVLDLNSGLVVCGEFVETDGVGFVENLQKLRERLKEGSTGKQ